MPVSTRRYGRLGNALYMYAVMIGYAKKHGLKYHFPTQTNDPVWNPIYFTHLALDGWIQGREDILLNEHQHNYFELPFKEEWRNQQIVLNGYFQSFRHFSFCRDEVLKVFDFPYEKKEGWCSIHIRRGDYLFYPTKHPVVTNEYIELALYLMYEKTLVKNILIHSDDLNWCRYEMVKPSMFHFEYSEGKTDIEDLVSMSCCEHQICSNSTLALWGAELNQNPDKLVIVPHENNWFGVDNKHLDVSDLYRPEWHQIKY